MKTFWIVVLVLVLIVLGFGGWYVFIRKVVDSGSCSISRCETNLKCINKVCSSGKAGSNCKISADCNTGLQCIKATCTNPPDYSKYFSKVVISKIKPGTGPGPNNPETITNIFTAADAIEIDFVGVKATTVGEFYYDIVDPTTGEVIRSSKNEIGIQQLEGQDRGTGTALDNLKAGGYELDVYFNNELVYSTNFTVN